MRAWARVTERIGRDERGASIVIVGISLIAIFGAAVLSVDAGNLWQSRRNIITATDAAAHQEARTAALLGGDEACVNGGAWEDILADNAGSDVNPINCEVVEVGDSGAGYVVVEADQPVDFRFAPILGIGDSNAFALSAAQHGFTNVIEEGLRPMGLCFENDHVEGWIDGSDTEDVHRVTWSKDNPDECGTEAAGNWGWFNFNDGNLSNDETKTWVDEGYNEDTAEESGNNGFDETGEVQIGGCDTGNEDAEACPGSTGFRSGGTPGTECDDSPDNLNEALTCLVVREDVFFLPIYDSVSCDTGGGSALAPADRALGTGVLAAPGGGGGGSNCDFHVIQFIAAQLVSFDLQGSSDAYLDFRFLDTIVSGVCCLSEAPGGIDTGIQVITLCGVDHDPLGDTALEERCAFDE